MKILKNQKRYGGSDKNMRKEWNNFNKIYISNRLEYQKFRP